ncbi:hypothetical protein FPHYL_10727 [Fusarium phyllophilum]|uniref:Uncharacterized protein n=1 Tax=Fusarium phyllophilum TaxID=47803 RepID=A0A8H5MYB9_9HYPO|nr:hypothetical protein FPHYL_10727 [Fusarium phyllophilum]
MSIKPSMPLPARWNATPSETDLIERFYKRVLLSEDVNSYSGILEELRSYRNKFIWKRCPHRDVIKLYQALEDLDVSGRERERMIEEFNKEAFIVYIPPDRKWEPSTWGTLNHMVWSHGVKLPRKVDISQQYPTMKSFSVSRLEIPELTMEAVQQQILDVAADAPADETFTLLSHLNIMIQNFAELIDPSELISKPIFPILTPSGELKRVCCATDFFIVDDMRLFKSFRDKDNMLAFTCSQVMRLESLIRWLGMGKKYLSRNVEHRVETPLNKSPREIDWDIGQKAEALLRCARITAYFWSRGTRSISKRNQMLGFLRAAKMKEVEVLSSEVRLTGINMRDSHHKMTPPGGYVKDAYPHLNLSSSDALVARVPADKKQRQLAMAVALPRLLMEWLMTGPESYSRGCVDVPELGVSLVKSVLSAPPELANDILEAEGIEQPFALRGNKLPGIMQEECLDQMEGREAEAPL